MVTLFWNCQVEENFKMYFCSILLLVSTNLVHSDLSKYEEYDYEIDDNSIIARSDKKSFKPDGNIDFTGCEVDPDSGIFSFFFSCDFMHFKDTTQGGYMVCIFVPTKECWNRSFFKKFCWFSKIKTKYKSEWLFW